MHLLLTAGPAQGLMRPGEREDEPQRCLPAGGLSGPQRTARIALGDPSTPTSTVRGCMPSVARSGRPPWRGAVTTSAPMWQACRS
jgi:hypothetical protein